MLVKKIGAILVFKLKLYKLIKILTLPLILISLILPFTEWNFNQAKEKYEFQQPSLRTKIFDIAYQQPNIKENILYDQWSERVKGVIFRGKLINECILITYPESIQQSNAIKILHSTLRNDLNLVKNVILLSYKEVNDLKNLFQSYLSGEKRMNFGTIRIALNINSEVRNREKGKANQIKAFLEIYGKGGLHADVDHFQSLKQLLQQLHVTWSPCQEIHQNPHLKQIKRFVYSMSQYTGVSRYRISTFLDHILCQGYRSFTSQYEKSHEVLMEFGFQSSSVTFLTSDPSAQIETKLLNSQKIAKFAYSFVKEYSIQQGHLHSSATFFYPIANHHYMSLLGTAVAGLLLFVVGIVNVIGYIAENSSKILSRISMFNLVQLVVFILQYRINTDLSISLAFLGVKTIFKLVISVLSMLRNFDKVEESLEYILLVGLSFLLSLYFSIFNFPIFYLSALLSVIMLTRNRKLITLFIIIFFSLITMDLYSLTIKSQNLVDSQQNLKQIVISSLQTIAKKYMHSINLQVKIATIPFIYGVSTFLL